MNLRLTRWILPILALLTVVAGLAQSAAPVLRATPTRPAQLWAITQFRDKEYVSLRDIARRFDLRIAGEKPGTRVTLRDARGVRFTFERDRADFYLDGARIFLGEPVYSGNDMLWVTKLDAIKIVAPLFRPADHSAFLPAISSKIIVLDAGHGGIDPGTQNPKLGLNEKTFTLEVAQRLKGILELQGWRVLMVRDGDTELSKDKKTDLLMRNDFANRNQADLFISIHFNALEGNPAVSGVETYTMSPQHMLSTGDDTGDSMTNVAYPSNRLDYANLLFGDRLHRALLKGLGTPDRGYKRGRRAVLRMLDCPGVLVECGFLSNDAEARRIATPEFRQQIAEALASGVSDYVVTLAALRPAVPPASQ